MSAESNHPYRLWCCHNCELIGSELQAKAHRVVSDHEVVKIEEHISDGIWDSWASDAIANLRGRWIVSKFHIDIDDDAFPHRVTASVLDGPSVEVVGTNSAYETARAAFATVWLMSGGEGTAADPSIPHVGRQGGGGS